MSRASKIIKALKSLNYHQFWLLFFATFFFLSALLQGDVSSNFTSHKASQNIETKTLSSSQRLLKGEVFDLNRASYSELVALPGIGPKLAERILSDRKRNGIYPNVESLRRVRGIGPKKLERIKKHLITR